MCHLDIPSAPNVGTFAVAGRHGRRYVACMTTQLTSAGAIAAGEEVLSPHSRALEDSVQSQMAAMHKRDIAMAWTSIVALGLVLPFMYVALWDVMPDVATKVVLLVSGVLLLLYNIASMVTLIRGYRRDHDFIYRRDVAHVIELRAAKGRP
jgi:hypothetical protein